MSSNSTCTCCINDVCPRDSNVICENTINSVCNCACLGCLKSVCFCNDLPLHHHHQITIDEEIYESGPLTRSIPLFTLEPSSQSSNNTESLNSEFKNSIKDHFLIIATIGLPATGKSFFSNQLGRYLRWLRYDTAHVSLGDFRRLVETPDKGEEDSTGTGYNNMVNSSANMSHVNKKDNLSPSSLKSLNDHYRDSALTLSFREIKTHLTNGCQIVIFDASNASIWRRNVLRNYLNNISPSSCVYSLMWLEFICPEKETVDNNINSACLFSPYYKDIPLHHAQDLFRDRIKSYLTHYSPITIEELKPRPHESYLKLGDGGRESEAYNTKGYLLTKMVAFLTTIASGTAQPVFLSRHGQSIANTLNVVGTDLGLSEQGAKYADSLGVWLKEHPLIKGHEVKIFCSTLVRTMQTANQVFTHISETSSPTLVQWECLSEIHAGIYDGLSYEEIERRDPSGTSLRKQDKLNYQYPDGESYKDVIDRVERVLLEILRAKTPLIVISHQGILRCILGFFLDTHFSSIPHLNIPLHQTMVLLTHSHGTELDTVDIMNLKE